MEKVEIGEVFTIGGLDEEEQEAEVLAVMNIEGQDYVAVSFVEDLEDENHTELDVYFLRVDEEGDFDTIEFEDEFEKVSAAFSEIYE